MATTKKTAPAAKKPKTIRVQTYTIVVKHDDAGESHMTRTNDGFNPIELLGLADFIAMEVREQIAGRIKPDIITRKAIKRI